MQFDVPKRPITSPTVESLELTGNWLAFARAVWISVALIGLIMFVIGVPLHYQQLTVPCPDAGCVS